MNKIVIFLLLTALISVPASASEFTAPTVPETAAEWMPESNSFGEGLWEMVQKAILYVNSDYRQAIKTGVIVLVMTALVSMGISLGSGLGRMYEIAGTIGISSAILLNTNSMIGLGSKTVMEITTYGKLLLPVLTAALAAQGGVSTSAALYAGTAVFNAVMSTVLSAILRPLVYCYLGLAVALAATGEAVLKNMRDLVKTFSGWCLKVLLTVFTTYMSITGVISGTTDAAALKATKVTISSFVPMVGSILSDASEAVLVSAGLAKNAAGIYGIFAILAIFLVPFFKIGIHYLVMKGTYAVCSILDAKRMVELINDYSSAMGMVLALTGSVCLIQLISTVCFLKGMG